jgi:Kef-type K+ transport system membrane component KefB
MFVVGYELDLWQAHGRRRAVPLVAVSALLVPFALGCGTALLFRSRFAALGEQHPGTGLVLFMGIALAITALPVLAAIVRDRDIAGTRAGVIALSSAGAMDVMAWLALAAVLTGTATSTGRSWPVTLGLMSCFVVTMLLGVRPALRWWLAARRPVPSTQLALALAIALGSASVTSSLGLHPVFGGFLAGLTMPSADGSPDRNLLSPLEEVAGVLLPLFFLVTGLSVNIAQLSSSALILLAVICVAASAGKLVPGYAAPRASGLSRAESATVAVLMNTRGLTELIALNVGLTAGLIGPQLFTVLVLMALITTLLTSPLLSLIGVATRRRGPAESQSLRGVLTAAVAVDGTRPGGGRAGQGAGLGCASTLSMA